VTTTAAAAAAVTGTATIFGFCLTGQFHWTFDLVNIIFEFGVSKPR